MASSSFCSIKKTVNSLSQDAYFQNASFGLYAVSEKTGKVLLDYHSEQSLLPNSILKVITTAAALKILKGPFSYQTKLSACGDIREGVLKGDLVIIGGGDPTLGSDRFKDDAVLEKWVAWVKDQGIKEIAGDVVGNSSFFEEALVPASWLLEDVGNYYGAGPCGLNFHDNTYAMTFKLGSKVGDHTSLVKMEPCINHLKHVNEVTTGEIGTGDRASVFGGEYATTQYIRGTLPFGTETYKIKASMPNPAEVCAGELKKKLEAKGVVICGKARAGREHYSEKALSRYYIHTSPSIAEIVYFTNKESINVYAECLLKTLGRIKKREGTLLYGLEVVNEYLDDLGVSRKGWHLADGSGLSSKNLVSAKGFVDFLLKVKNESYFPDLLHSLPSKKEDRAGIFKCLLLDPILQDKLFIKTGYSSQGQSIAGFLINQSGDKIAFCILCNRFLGSPEKLQKKVRKILCQLESAE